VPQLRLREVDHVGCHCQRRKARRFAEWDESRPANRRTAVGLRALEGPGKVADRALRKRNEEVRRLRRGEERDARYLRARVFRVAPTLWLQKEHATANARGT